MEMFVMLHVGTVQEQYVTRMRRKLQFEERKQADQRRVLSDSETVRWLNHAVERIWPICMEQIASQKILLPIIPWFLEKYKPWTVKKAVAQHLYLGRDPPMFTEMRVLRQSSDDDHLVMELGMNFLTADDMSAIIAVQLRKRLGFGMWAKLHITGMHVEGKVLIGVKFLHKWPFIGRLRVCFAEPPYFQMTVKPIFTHGLDVTEIPGIAGWLDKLLSVAFEQTLVEPNMLVVDMEKFASPQPEGWFSVDEKKPVAYAKLEVIEASDMKPSDPNGLADPYVKGQLGTYRFRTKTQRKTLAPKWHEEFKIPIFTWESANMLCIEVRDKDYFVDDTLGDCSVNISDLRDGQRHDRWLPLQNIKMGRLHLAITVLEDNKKETLSMEDKRNSFAETDLKGSFSSVSSLKSPRVPDNFEPIEIEGQTETGIWVHHPGSEVSQRWEPRKGKSRRMDTKIHSEPNGSMNSFNAAASGSLSTDTSLRKIGSIFHMIPRKEDPMGSSRGAVQSPHVNLRAVNSKEIGVKFVMEGNGCGNASGKNLKVENVTSPKGSGSESPRKGNMKGMAKSILRHAGKSARGIKHVISREGSKNSRGDALVGAEREVTAESDHSEDESSSSPGVERISSIPEATCSDCIFYPSDSEEHVVQTYSNEDHAMGIEGPNENESVEELEKKDDKPGSHDQRHDGVEESLQPKLAGVDLEGDKR
ncbi:hypothetical protein CIPAW_12G046400 [Carya illinoinensis]|uniref:C2 domain-containing protein n=1 Tax=Carya illinoinensis TaxID=32201 RepID=A0A8T1NP74_CARIL|nr:hypothetical protein CIPAW_12G046400 [Carya illinoinensis]